MSAPLLSIIVPVKDEEAAIPRFLDVTQPVLANLIAGLGPLGDYEIIFVDDGSSDGTLSVLAQAHCRDGRIKVLSLSRNFGKEAALTAGLEVASGAAVIPMDVDLQDPPELIVELVAKWLDGYEVVYGVRVERSSDGWLKRSTADWFYRAHNFITDSKIPAHAGDFRLMDRRVVDVIRALPERTRFMKGLFSWAGFRQAAVPYTRPERSVGTSRWRYWRLWNFALDGIASASTVPLRVWSYLGLAVALMAFAYAAVLVIRTMVSGVDVPGYASIMATLLFLGGIQLISVGVLGEYIGRIFTEVKGRPVYVVRDRVGFGVDQNRKDEPWSAPSSSAWPRSTTSIGGSLRAAKSLRA